MTARSTLIDVVSVIGLPVILVAIFLGALFYVTSDSTGEGVSTKERGEYKIVEIETHGEKHEYLYYHQMYRGSITHLPNCKYCK